MGLHIVEVTTKKHHHDFINLPWKIYKGSPHWVPPLKIAENEKFKSSHPFFAVAKLKRFVAYHGKEPLGRIAAIINHKHNQFHEEKSGQFGFFETIADQEVAHQLLSTAENFLRQEKQEIVRGPMNPSTNYECGMLVNGFDDPPQIMMPYNHSYYIDLLEQEGYLKAKDLLAYRLQNGATLPEKIVRIAERVKTSQNITCRPINLKNWKQEVETLLDIYNQAWEKNWGFIPYTPEEFRHMANDLKLLCVPELALIMQVRGVPVGVMVALPDYNQIFKQIPNGKLLPWGIFKLLTGKKKISRLRVLIMGIKKEYRTMGLSTLFYTEIFKAASQMPQYKEAEMSWILEDNYAMNHPMQVMNADVYKTYRIFEKKL